MSSIESIKMYKTNVTIKKFDINPIYSFTSIDFDDRPSEKDCINLDFTNTKLVNNFAENCEHQE